MLCNERYYIKVPHDSCSQREMKFNINNRRISERQTTSEFLEGDRFAGVQHETVVGGAASAVGSTVRTPKRVLDELENSELAPPSEPNPESSPRAVPASADETIFDLPPPPTTQGVLDQGQEISALHTRAQRDRGFRKRGHVAYTQYTFDPGHGIHYKHYVDQLYTGSPVEHYTQVLIWCLYARISVLKSQQDICARDQAAINALNSLIYRLARGDVGLNWTRQTFTNLPEETERAPNPVNAHNTQQVQVLKAFLADLKSENKEWMQLLAETDESQSQSQSGSSKHERVIKLPRIEVGDGLAAISRRVAGLEAGIEDAEQGEVLRQPPALLRALNLA